MLILALFLALNLKDFAVRLFLELTFFLFKFALELTLEIVKLYVELRLDFALLSLQALNVAALTFKLLVLFVFELLQFKLISLFFALLNCFPDALVTASQCELLSLELLLQLPFKIGQPLLSIGSDHLHLLFLFDSEFLFEIAQL